MTDPKRTAVIAAIGEIIDRKNATEPRALIAEAARQALAEGQRLAERIDSIDVVGMVSWRYENIASLIAEDIGADPTHARESKDGGEKPVRLVAEAAARIAAGESQGALVCGGEATRTRAQAAKSGTKLDWGPTDFASRPPTPLDFVTAQAARYELTQPVNVYSLYENATRHAWSQSFAEGQAESAALWSLYAAQAASNPFAWLKRDYSAEEIGAATAENRMIAYPYRKLMVANPMVNQAAAVLVTSLAAAREAEIPEDQLIFIGSGARADEPRDFLARANFVESPAQDAVLQATLAANGLEARDVDLFELYSCFPTVPKMARRALGLSDAAIPTIAGGLTFFGGPANNYMTHALTAAVRALRGGRGDTALLYGQGEFITKHAALILSRTPCATSLRFIDVQAQAEAVTRAAPALVDDYAGRATIESFTVLYDRDGSIRSAPIIVRTPDGARTVTMGKLDGTDLGVWLTDATNNPIGAPGVVHSGADGRLVFTRAAG